LWLSQVSPTKKTGESMGLSTATKNMAGDSSKKNANGAPSAATAKYNLPSHFIGGSHLGVATPSKVKDFVAAHGGHTVITNVRKLLLFKPPRSKRAGYGKQP